MACHEFKVGEEPADLIDERYILNSEWNTWTWNTSAYTDRNVELNTLRVDRVELLVVDRNLRVESSRECSRCLYSESFNRILELAHALHTLIRVDLE
ncbi:unannotated protein [freshwater metagenome]|uniref:Unannotated protein n=1 Tax=freshwater metagenome TaxID=449393 RepID=A0A6J7RBE9_9ZZZZ